MLRADEPKCGIDDIADDLETIYSWEELNSSLILRTWALRINGVISLGARQDPNWGRISTNLRRISDGR